MPLMVSGLQCTVVLMCSSFAHNTRHTREVKESQGLHSGWTHVWRGLVPLMVSLERASAFNGSQSYNIL